MTLRKHKLNTPFPLLLCLIVLLTTAFSQPDGASPVNIPGFTCYRGVNEIYASMHALAEEYPDLVEIIDIGDSWEKLDPAPEPGFDLLVFRLNNRVVVEPKPRLVLVAGLRANAFAPVEVLLRFAEQLLLSYNTDPEATWMLDHLDLNFVFTANPDGRLRAEGQSFVGAKPEDITWSKNTNPGDCPGSGGVALNHNFAFAWQPGEQNACLETYPGQAPGSEPETAALQVFLAALQDSYSPSTMLINLESYGDRLVTPLLSTKIPNDHTEQLYTLANKLTFDSEVEPFSNLSPVVDILNGTLVDHAFGELSIPSLLLTVGNQYLGGHVTRCSFFEDLVVGDILGVLRRAARAAAGPYEMAEGPEIAEIEINQSGKYLNIKGSADDMSFYWQPDHAGTVDSMYFSVDSPPWIPGTQIYPVDSLTQNLEFPFMAEFSLRFDLSSLSPGRHTLYLQALDDTSNAGFVESLFVYPFHEHYLPWIGKPSAAQD